MDYEIIMSVVRDQLKRHYNIHQYWVQVDLQDLSTFDSQLAAKLCALPAEYLPLVSHPISKHDMVKYSHTHCGW